MQQIFDSSQGFTIPDGVTSLTVECIGGGGPGGNGEKSGAPVAAVNSRVILTW